MTSSDAEIRLLIADDHGIVRDLVAAHLTAQGGFAVATAETLAAARRAIADQGPFDLVLLDYALPDSRGLSESVSLITENGGRPVVLFSGLARPETVTEALELGFSGYIPKSTSARALAEAIRQVLAGVVWVPEGYAEAPLPAPLADLSPREMEVLRAIRAGRMNKEIAAEMGLSEVTVKMHVRSLCAKLRARNRTQAAMIAAELLP